MAMFAGLRRQLPWVFLSIAALALGSAPGSAAVIVIVNKDGPSEGLNDPAPIAAAGGNAATTLGAARLAAVEFAADLLADALDSPLPIEVAVSFDPMGGSPSLATLGLGSPTSAYRDFSGAPRTATWYAAAVANAVTGVDLDEGTKVEAV